MNRVQWLAQQEISRLEELLKQPSIDESQIAAVIEELRGDSDRARQQRRRDRKRL
jgi:hypothetical protein